MVGIASIAVALAIGIPLQSLAPFVAVGACLGMHVLMGHGMGHGAHDMHARGEHQGDAADARLADRSSQLREG